MTQFQYRQDYLIRIYNRGHAAYYNGEPVESNPYGDDEVRDAWEKGWYQAQLEDEDDVDEDDIMDASSFDIGINDYD